MAIFSWCLSATSFIFFPVFLLIFCFFFIFQLCNMSFSSMRYLQKFTLRKSQGQLELSFCCRVLGVHLFFLSQWGLVAMRFSKAKLLFSASGRDRLLPTNMTCVYDFFLLASRFLFLGIKPCTRALLLPAHAPCLHINVYLYGNLLHINILGYMFPPNFHLWDDWSKSLENTEVKKIMYIKCCYKGRYIRLLHTRY